MDDMNQTIMSVGLKPVSKEVEGLIKLKQAQAQIQQEKKPSIIKVI